MEFMTFYDFLVSSLATSIYIQTDITLVCCIRTQLLHGLRAKTKKTEQRWATKKSVIHNIKFNDSNTNKRGVKIKQRNVNEKDCQHES